MPCPTRSWKLFARGPFVLSEVRFVQRKNEQESLQQWGTHACYMLGPLSRSCWWRPAKPMEATATDKWCRSIFIVVQVPEQDPQRVLPW